MLHWKDHEKRTVVIGGETVNGVEVQLQTKAQVHGRATRSSSHLVLLVFRKTRVTLFSWAPTWTQIYRLIELLAKVDPHFLEKMEPIHDLIHDKYAELYRENHGPE